MRQPLTASTHSLANGLTLAIALVISLAGCGDQTEPGADAPPADAQAVSTTVELVIEPSEKTLVVAGGSRDSLAVLNEVVSAYLSVASENYEIKPDDRFDQPGRLRLLVTPLNEPDEAADRAAAAALFDALADAFADRAEQAVRDELASVKSQIQRDSETTQTLQAELKAYQAGRRGLPVTNESRQERRRLDHAIQQLLDRQIDLGQQAEALERAIDRGRWATLVRVR